MAANAHDCPECNGSGFITVLVEGPALIPGEPAATIYTYEKLKPCSKCKGLGLINEP